MESLWNFVGTAATTRGSYGLENYAYIMEYVYFSAKKRPVFSEKPFGADARIMQKHKKSLCFIGSSWNLVGMLASTTGSYGHGFHA